MFLVYTGSMTNNAGIPREPHDPGDAVETTRTQPDDRETIQRDYDHLQSIQKLSEKYGLGFKATRNLLARHGIQIASRGSRKGSKKSQAWREASSKRWNDPAWREEQRQKWIERVKDTPTGNTNSPLERALHRALRSAGISFKTQQLLLGKYLVDVLITQKPVVIEADGNHHLLAEYRKKDQARDADLKAAGYEVYRFHGKVLIPDPDECVRQVVEGSALTPEENPQIGIYNGARGTNNPNWRGGKPTWTCQMCGKKFQAYLVGRTTVKFCGRECSSAGYKLARSAD